MNACQRRYFILSPALSPELCALHSDIVSKEEKVKNLFFHTAAVMFQTISLKLPGRQKNLD